MTDDAPAFTPSVLAKARTLVADGRVYPTGVDRLYTVIGDTSGYAVEVDDDREWAACTCPHSTYSRPGSCSHAAAVLLTRSASTEPEAR